MLFITGLHFESPTFSSRSLTQAHLHRRIIDVLWRGARAHIILQKSEFFPRKSQLFYMWPLATYLRFRDWGSVGKSHSAVGETLNVQIPQRTNLLTHQFGFAVQLASSPGVWADGLGVYAYLVYLRGYL